jgi:hypothetical protein
MNNNTNIIFGEVPDIIINKRRNYRNIRQNVHTYTPISFSQFF